MNKSDHHSVLTGGNAGPSRQLVELLGTALIDQELRNQLFCDVTTVAERFGLPAEEAEALKRLDRDGFERAATALRWR
jgi:hypothetical protein